MSIAAVPAVSAALSVQPSQATSQAGAQTSFAIPGSITQPADATQASGKAHHHHHHGGSASGPQGAASPSQTASSTPGTQNALNILA